MSTKEITLKPFGTSHSPCIGADVYFLPRGFEIKVAAVERELTRRRTCVGRSSRQSQEGDKIYFVRGLRRGKTHGKRMTFVIENVVNAVAANAAEALPPITALRPNHADVAAAAKYGVKNIRAAAEMTSGRNTVPHTVLGAVCRQILTAECGAAVTSRVLRIGQAVSDCGCPPDALTPEMLREIVAASAAGDSLGGVVEITCAGFPAGLGAFLPFELKLSSRIAAYLGAIPSVKSVEFGLGLGFCGMSGSDAADKLTLENGKITYQTNNCGGICGGVSTGAPIVVRLGIKPVPTVKCQVDAIDAITLEKTKSHFERADTCAVPAIAVVAENMLARILLCALFADKKL